MNKKESIEKEEMWIFGDRYSSAVQYPWMAVNRLAVRYSYLEVVFRQCIPEGFVFFFASCVGQFLFGPIRLTQLLIVGSFSHVKLHFK